MKERSLVHPALQWVHSARRRVTLRNITWWNSLNKYKLYLLLIEKNVQKRKWGSWKQVKARTLQSEDNTLKILTLILRTNSTEKSSCIKQYKRKRTALRELVSLKRGFSFMQCTLRFSSNSRIPYLDVSEGGNSFKN